MASYKIDNMRIELQNDLARARALASAWGAVSRNFTKGGAPFKVLSKNFSGCRFTTKGYSDDPIIRVSADAGRGAGWAYDDIDVRIYLNGYNNDMRPADADRIVADRYFDRNADELEPAIKAAGVRWGKRAADLEKMLSAFDNAVAAYIPAYAAALQALEDAAGGQNSLYHGLIRSVSDYDGRDYLKRGCI